MEEGGCLLHDRSSDTVLGCHQGASNCSACKAICITLSYSAIRHRTEAPLSCNAMFSRVDISEGMWCDIVRCGEVVWCGTVLLLGLVLCDYMVWYCVVMWCGILAMWCGTCVVMWCGSVWWSGLVLYDGVVWYYVVV